MTNNLTCWNCSASIKDTDLFCPSCNKIQPATQINHFERLGVNIGFDIGIKNLEVAYFALQTKLHPDRFANKTKEEQLFSAEQSTNINEAYEVLKDPLMRAQYMLQLNGIIVNKDNATIDPSQKILAENLEIREKLSGSLSGDQKRQMAIDAMEQKLSLIEKIGQGFLANNLEDVAQDTIALRYLEKLIEEIKAKN